MNKHSQIVAVVGIVFDGERVLAMRRAATNEAGAGLWETLSGRVTRGEEPLKAIRREIREECGLEVTLDERPVATYATVRAGSPMIVIAFRARRLGGDVVRSDEHDDHGWWTPAEFRSRSTLTTLADVVDQAARLPW